MIERRRGRALMELRARHFRRHPLCVMCMAQGRLTEATQLDHIIPLVRGGLDDSSNVQGLCVPCHKVKTAIDMGHKQRPVIGLDGYPVT
jgi:5-methylcytosine-specific restriction protein A